MKQAQPTQKRSISFYETINKPYMFIYLLLISRDSKITSKIPNVPAVIFCQNLPYQNSEGYLYLDQKRKMGLVKRIKRQIDKFDIKPEGVGLLNT